MTNPQKDKDARLDRHSAGKTPAYGTSGHRHGAGKYNWGGDVSPETAEPADKNDPMYDSDGEEKASKTSSEAGTVTAAAPSATGGQSSK